MKQHISKRFLLVVGAVLLMLIGYGIAYSVYRVRVYTNGISTVSDLGDVREAFFKFREVHRRWPSTMKEVHGIGTSEGVVTREYHDSMSGSPFCCVAGKELYYRIGGKPYKVLVVLPQPYRSELWPFGEMRTIIASFSGVHYISPSEIIDMSGRPGKDVIPKAND
jgi:hypothetical protein